MRGLWRTSIQSTEDLLSSYGALAGALLLGLFTLAATAVAWFVPLANWDMFAYVATALEGRFSDIQMLHQAAYQAVAERVEEGDFLVLTQDRDYRIRQYADPAAFATMLGFYRVKLLYVELATLLSGLMHPVDALRLISTASAALYGLLVIFWAWQRQSLKLAPLILALLILAAIAPTARFAVPDLMASVFVLAACLAFLRRADLLAALCLLLAFFTRPDHLAFLAVLATLALFMKREGLWLAAAALIAFASYFLLTGAADHPGWWVQIWFTHIEYVETLEGFSPAFSVIAYLRVIIQVVVRSLVEETWAAILLVELFALWVLRLHGSLFMGRERLLLAALVATIAAKFFVMPMHETRFHLAYIVPIGLILIDVAARSFRPARAHMQKPRS